MNNELISIICPCNNKDILEMLLTSLKKQKNQNYEIVIVDTIEQKFSSAVDALSYGASKAKGTIFVFCHQDIEFLSYDAIDIIYKYCLENDFGIAGVAGVNSGKLAIFSSVRDGPQHLITGTEIHEVTPIDVLDECLFIIKKDKFMGFDSLGATWHFYAVDYCMKSIASNKKNLLFPIRIYHQSPGYSINYNFFKILKKLGKKYKGSFKYVTTTIINVKNDSFFGLRVFWCKTKFFVKNVLRKMHLVK